MMTIDIETISGVPLTGVLNTTRPITSATTRKLKLEDQHRGKGEQHAHQPGIPVVEHGRVPGGLGESTAGGRHHAAACQILI